MTVPWHEYEYPAARSEERLAKGLDRCQSPGLARVQRLEALIEGGLIVDQGTRTPLSTPGPDSPGRWIFAVKQGQMRLAPDGGSRWSAAGLPPGAIKHETLFSNAPVSAAGEIFISAGAVVQVNASSGSYNCDIDEQFVGALLEALRNAGVVVTEDLRRSLA